MKNKFVIIILVLILCSTIAWSYDIIRFSGQIGDTIGGSVNSCGNDVCQEEFGEDYDNCPEDCEEPESFLNVNLIDYYTSGLSNNSYDGGWWFKFKLDFYYPTSVHESVHFGLKLDDFSDGLGHTIPIDGNVRFEYINKSGDSHLFYVTNEYSYIKDELYDISPDIGIQSIITLQVKLPIETYPSYYTANYYWRYLLDE